MFCKLALLSFVAPLVSALTLNIPTNPTTGGTVTITWTTASGDPSTFSIELINTSFNNAYAIANNVQTSDGTITLTLPAVPVGAGYTLEAVDIGNINSVYSTTGGFSVGAATSTSAASSTSGSSTASGSASSSGTLSATASGSSVSGSSSTTLGSATTIATSTTPTSAASTATGSSFSAASGLKVPTGGFAVALLSAVAGAVAVAL